ncbi:DUF3626 domain-containing protein [Pseudobacillus badius]|uniref:DUF3626 domain-containing protein n=1 Tax=Bacillus badius TaxID=1455 RepID=UPI003CF66773
MLYLLRYLKSRSVSAYIGGERNLWEKQTFGGACQLEGTTNKECPEYGALNLMLHSDGSSPSFGSCYFFVVFQSLTSFYIYIFRFSPKFKGKGNL